MFLKNSVVLFAAMVLFNTHLLAQDSTNLALPKDSTARNPAFLGNNIDRLKDSLVAQFKTPIAPNPITLRSMVVPVTLISYGALTFASKDLKNLNETIREEWGGNTNRKPLGFDGYAKFFPAVAVYGLNMTGIKGKHNLADRTMLYGLSNLIGGGITASAKRLAGVTRPDSSDRFSFPSGHATGAFIAAEFLRQEYRDVSPWYGVAGYAVATGTGLLRIYNNKHWLNDVVAGAGVGILATRVAYWLYPVLKNSVNKNKRAQTLVVPTYQQGTVGMVLVHYF